MKNQMRNNAALADQSQIRDFSKWLVRLIWAALIGFQVYFLFFDTSWVDYFSLDDQADTPVVGKLARARQDVELQNPGRLVWGKGSQEEELHFGQGLWTQGDGHAEIEFLDGSGLVIGPQTLIYLDQYSAAAEGQVGLTLERGLLSRRSGTTDVPLRVSSGDAVVVIPPTADVQFVASPGQVKKIQLQVREGQVSLQTPFGKVEVSQGNRIELEQGADGTTESKPTVSKLLVSLLSPRDGESLWSDGSKKRVTFSWKWLSPGIPAILEISSSLDFSKNRTEYRVSSDQTEEQVELAVDQPVNRFYWRLKGEGLEATSEKFQVEQASAPQPTYPISSTEVPAQMGSMSLLWKKDGQAGRYEVQILRDKGKPRVYQVESNQFEFPTKREGFYQWKVRSLYPASEGKVHKGQWSTPRRFEVFDDVAPDAPSIGAPEVTPESDAGLRWSNELRASLFWPLVLLGEWAAQAEAPKTWQVKMNWKPSKGARSYVIQVARSKSFKHIYVEKKLTDPEFVWVFQSGMEDKKGNVYFRVASVGRRGRKGAFSVAKVVQIPVEVRSSRSGGKVELAQKESKAPAGPKVGPAGDDGEGLSATGPPTPEKGEPTPRSWRWTVALPHGLSDFQQNSNLPQFSSVATRGIALQQGVSARVDRVIKNQAWSGLMELDAFGLGPQSGPRVPFNQATFPVIHARATASWENNAGWSGWFYGVGLEADLYPAFLKTGVQSVELLYSMSLGPVGWFGFRWDRRDLKLMPTEVETRLELPLLGLAWKGFGGVGLAARAEWKLWTWWKSAVVLPREKNHWVGISLLTDFRFLRYQAPASTTLWSWKIAIAPTIHFFDLSFL